MNELWGIIPFAFEVLNLFNLFVGGVGYFNHVKLCPVEYTGSTRQYVFVVFSCPDGGEGRWFLTGTGVGEDSVSDVGHGREYLA